MDRDRAISLMDELSSEHKVVLDRLKALEGAKGVKEVKRRSREIRRDLEAHFKKEEDQLFPFLNKYFKREMERMGGPIRPVGGPIQVMLAEHKLILQAMDELQSAKGGELEERLQRYLILQRSHIFREDCLLFRAALTFLKEV